MINRIARMTAVISVSAAMGLLGPSTAAFAVQVPTEAGPPMEKAAADFDLRQPGYAAKSVAQLRLPPIAAERLQSLRERNSKDDEKALQIGVDRILIEEGNFDQAPALQWESLASGGQVARLAIASPGAQALRVGLRVDALPERAELRFVGDGQLRSVVAAMTGGQIKPLLADSIFWTPVTPGERQTIEIYVPYAVSYEQLRISIDRVAHLYASPYGSLDGLKIGESQPCEIDANCVSNPSNAYLLAKSAVARMSFQNGGSFVCTGTLLNDTVPSTFIPYFFSANHCISTQAVASTLTTFWFEESTSCGSGIASARTQLGGGSTLLFNSPDTDALLLRLNNPAPGGAAYTGWDSNPVLSGTNILVLHHPAGDVKKVSQGQITGFGIYQGVGSFIRVGYTQASTEGGSSGAGLLVFANSQYQLRGGLFGGSASCSNTGSISTPANTDAYSRFDVVYPSLAPFLSPNTAQQLQLSVVRAGSGSGTVTSTPAGINCGAVCSANFDSGTQVLLTASAASGSTFGGFAGCDSVSGNSCGVSLGAARSVTATFNGSGGGGGGGTLQNGVPVSGLAGATGSTLAYTISIPVGATNLVVQTSGGTGDPDLYVRFGTPPTTAVYDCRGFDAGPAANCTFANPSAGTYHVLIHGFTAFSGLTLTASWQTGSGSGVDEPSFSNFLLPLPTNPTFPACPGGYFVAAVQDGPGPGLSPGIFGLELLVNAPGTQRLEGGLNFGGLLDGSQVAFAGFNFQNPANEQQRLDLILNGSPASNQNGSLPVRVKLIRQPAPGVNELVLEFSANLSMAQQVMRTINLTPAFYVVTVAPEGAASVSGGAADGQVFVSLSSQFVNRAGGGFFAGVVVGGYHAAHPFGGVSGFASFCLATQHSSNARLLSAPSYGVTGARDLRLRVLDHANREVIRVPQ